MRSIVLTTVAALALSASVSAFAAGSGSGGMANQQSTPADPNYVSAKAMIEARNYAGALPLLPATAGPVEAYRRQPQAHGGEHYVAILFADIRGFTSISEGKLPYDVVFLLNRYFRATGQAVQSAGGRLDKFIGDGVMAIFGLDRAPEVACRQALDAARRMALALDDLNEALSGDLDQPLRIGIGLHSGPTIVGQMGYERATQLTAIGDTVNTASRLEALTKEFGVELVEIGRAHV